MKRVISLIMVLVLAVGLLSGCGGKKKGDAASILKGEVIKVAAWGDFSPIAGTELGDARLERIKAAEEKYGCTVEFVTISDIFSQMKLAASSGEVLADVLTTRAHYIPPLARTDAFWSMEELTDTSLEVYNQDTFANTKVKDKTYGFWYDPYYVGSVLYFNKGILERNGINIEELYQKALDRKWTYDEWLSIMQKVTDVNAGIMGCGMGQAFDATVMKSNDASIYAQDSTGKWVQNTADNRVLESLSFMADCVNKWKVMEGNSGRDWTYCPTQFQAGKYAFLLTYTWSAESQAYDNMSDDYGMLPMPLGPSAKEYVNVANELKTFCIQKSVPKERAVALVEFMNDAFSYPLDPETSIESYYSTLVKDKQSLEVLMMLDKLTVEQVDEFTTPDIRGTEIIGALEKCSKGKAPIRSTLDSYSGTIQSLLDEYYGQ